MSEEIYETNSEGQVFLTDKAKEIFNSPNYTPYYFRYKVASAADLINTKNKILNNFRETSIAKISNGVVKSNGSVDEYFNLLNDLSNGSNDIGAGLESLLEEAGAEAVNYFSRGRLIEPGVNDATFGNIEKNFSETISRLTNGVDTFVDSVNDALINLINEVGKTYPALEEIGLAEYLANGGQLSNPNAKKLDIVNSALSTIPDGSLLNEEITKRIQQAFSNSEDAAVVQSLTRIIQRVQAIQVVASGGINYSKGNVVYSNNRGVTNQVVKSKNKVFELLMGKISGGASNLMGIFFEAAFYKALGKSDNEFKKALINADYNKFFSYHSGNSNNGIVISTEFTEDPSFKKWLEENSALGSVSHNKEDIGIFIGNDKCIFQIGFSLKKHSVNTKVSKSGVKTKSTSVKIASTTSVGNLIREYLAKSNINLSDKYIRSLLYSHGNEERGITDTDLARVWRSYIQSAILENLSTYLIGNGDIYNNASLMIVNKRVISMKEIIDNIFKANEGNSLAFKGISVSGADISGTYQRKENKWLNASKGYSLGKNKKTGKYLTGEKSLTMAERRSDQVSNLYQSFIKKNVQISLNLTTLSIKGFK